MAGFHDSQEAWNLDGILFSQEAEVCEQRNRPVRRISSYGPKRDQNNRDEWLLSNVFV